jgi:succinate dehydrogenase / fumarate reductase, membrane anchor subunit
MAVDAERPAPTVHRDDSLGTGLPRQAGRGRPGKGGEFWWWAFMRVSGIVLLVLAVGHVLIMHVLGNGVDRVNFAFVALRWQSPFWRTWDWLMLSLALLHGVNGLRMISLDYIRRPGIRIAVNWLFNITGVVLFALGSIVVFTFDPSKWPGTGA